MRFNKLRDLFADERMYVIPGSAVLEVKDEMGVEKARQSINIHRPDTRQSGLAEFPDSSQPSGVLDGDRKEIAPNG